MRRKVYPLAMYTQLSDKYLVREYIERLWGKEYLIELYAQGKKLTEEMYESLPNTFVIKANHGSGYNKLVFDKSQTSFNELRVLTNSWLRQNFYQVYRERHYKDISPCIMVEKMLLEDGKTPNDIKIHCFNRNGEVRFSFRLITSALSTTVATSSTPTGTARKSAWGCLTAMFRWRNLAV